MRIEHKARAHIERAQELLQNDLAFGALSWSLLPDVVRRKVRDELNGQVLNTMSQVNKEELKQRGSDLYKERFDAWRKSVAMRELKKLKDAWQNNDKATMDNEHVVFAAMQSRPNALQYASERIQKNKALATLAFSRDGNALILYAENALCLKKVFQMLLTQYNSGDISLDVIRQKMEQMFIVHLPKHRLPPITHENLSGDFESKFFHICDLEHDERLKHATERTYEIMFGIFPADPEKAKTFKEICSYEMEDMNFRKDLFDNLKNETKGNSLFTS